MLQTQPWLEKKSMKTTHHNCVSYQYTFLVSIRILTPLKKEPQTSNPETKSLFEPGFYSGLWARNIYLMANVIKGNLYHSHHPPTCVTSTLLLTPQLYLLLRRGANNPLNRHLFGNLLPCKRFQLTDDWPAFLIQNTRLKPGVILKVMDHLTFSRGFTLDNDAIKVVDWASKFILHLENRSLKKLNSGAFNLISSVISKYHLFMKTTSNLWVWVRCSSIHSHFKSIVSLKAHSVIFLSIPLKA